MTDKYRTATHILAEIRASHELFLSAVMAWRKNQNRETRARLDYAECQYEDVFRLLHDPERPYRDRHGRQVANPPSGEDQLGVFCSEGTNNPVDGGLP